MKRGEDEVQIFFCKCPECKPGKSFSRCLKCFPPSNYFTNSYYYRMSPISSVYTALLERSVYSPPPTPQSKFGGGGGLVWVLLPFRPLFEKRGNRFESLELEAMVFACVKKVQQQRGKHTCVCKLMGEVFRRNATLQQLSTQTHKKSTVAHPQRGFCTVFFFIPELSKNSRSFSPTLKTKTLFMKHFPHLFFSGEMERVNFLLLCVGRGRRRQKNFWVSWHTTDRTAQTRGGDWDWLDSTLENAPSPKLWTEAEAEEEAEGASIHSSSCQKKGEERRDALNIRGHMHGWIYRHMCVRKSMHFTCTSIVSSVIIYCTLQCCLRGYTDMLAFLPQNGCSCMIGRHPDAEKGKKKEWGAPKKRFPDCSPPSWPRFLLMRCKGGGDLTQEKALFCQCSKVQQMI